MPNPWLHHKACEPGHTVLGECAFCMLEKSWNAGFAEGTEANTPEDNAYDNGYTDGVEASREGAKHAASDATLSAYLDECEWDDLLTELWERPGGVLMSPPR
mgnify:CR=1 FL=1